MNSVGVSQRQAALIAGFSLPFAMVLVVFANFYIGANLIVPSNAVDTAKNILAHETRFHVWVACNLLYAINVIAISAAPPGALLRSVLNNDCSGYELALPVSPRSSMRSAPAPAGPTPRSSSPGMTGAGDTTTSRPGSSRMGSAGVPAMCTDFACRRSSSPCTRRPHTSHTSRMTSAAS